MKSWKERMRNALISGFIVSSLLISMSVTIISAQEIKEVQDQGEYHFIVEETLDQIEKNLDSAVGSEELSIEPVISETLEVEMKPSKPLVSRGGTYIEVTNGNIPVEPDSGEEGVEVRELDVIAAVEDQSDELKEASEIKIIPLLHAEASSLIEALDQMKSPEGEVSYNEEDRTLILKDTIAQLEKMSAFVKRIDVFLETRIFALEYAFAQDIVVNIKKILTENVGQVQFDEESNSIIATDTPIKIGEIKELIGKLDRFNVEVSIGSRILKIVLNDEHLQGVDWEAIVSEYQKLPLFGKKDDSTEQLSLGTVSQEDYDILLEALDTVGVVRTVFEGDIKVENGTTETVNSLTSRRQNEKIQFHLTPMVKKDEPLEVDITMKEEGRENVTVQMENGETIVIGGLFENVMVASTWKIPLLGDLPLLGFVFRNEGEKSRKIETITFLTVKTVEKKKL